MYSSLREVLDVQLRSLCLRGRLIIDRAIFSALARYHLFSCPDASKAWICSCILIVWVAEAYIKLQPKWSFSLRHLWYFPKGHRELCWTLNGRMGSLVWCPALPLVHCCEGRHGNLTSLGGICAHGGPPVGQSAVADAPLSVWTGPLTMCSEVPI